MSAGTDRVHSMDAVDVVTIVFSGVALIASLFTVGWTLVQSRWERPVVVVTGREGHLTNDEHGTRWFCSVDVVNVGERAVTVTDVGWYTLRREDGHDALRPTKAGLPIRLEPHDSRTWTTYSSVAAAQRHTVNEPFVVVVQRPTWRERRNGVEAEREILGKTGGVFKM